MKTKRLSHHKIQNTELEFYVARKKITQADQI